MATSPLLTLARDSIREVLQAENIINKEVLLQKFPLLNQKVATQVAIYLKDEIFGYATSLKDEKSLLEDIIFNAKSAAFFSKKPLSSSEYLHAEVEVSLITLDEDIKEFENNQFLAYLNSDIHGIILLNGEDKIDIPSHITASNIDNFFTNIHKEFHIEKYQVYTLEKARDSAILGEA